MQGNINAPGIKFIGLIHSPYKTRYDAPPQGKGNVSEIEVFKEYAEGLQDVGGFSHLHIFYWLHESNGYHFSVTTPWDPNPHGLFATRTPNRPNPLGYSVVELLERKGNVLKVTGLDAIDGTPVIDIKPYIPQIDSKGNATNGWLGNKEIRC